MVAKRRWLWVGAVALLAAGACTGDPSGSAAPGGTTVGTAPTGPTDLTAQLLAVEQDPKYALADWGYVVLDRDTGEVLATQNDSKMFDPGSTMKTYAVATAMEHLGSDYEFRTPVYQDGSRSGDTLDGNLVLVASGDLTFGLRAEPDGDLWWPNLPEIDHSYASIGFPGAVMPEGDPLSGLDELAAAVKASGVTRVDGDVVIDDRLFEEEDWPDGLISPIWVNENFIDIEVTPGAAAGDATALDWRPQTASYTVDNQATTVASSGTSSLQVSEPTPGHLVVTGTVAAGSSGTLVTQEVKEPSAFARTAFIEALQRAGVTVTAAPTGPNPDTLLPAEGSYQDADKLGEHTSTDLAAYVQLIMKISYNRGADLMTCITAAKLGSKQCADGLQAEIDTATANGVEKNQIYPFDGAGSNDQDRTTPIALATFYQRAYPGPYGQALFDSLPILGEDGSLTTTLKDSPAAGKAFLKTGNRAAGTSNDHLILLGNSLAGYMEAKSGRQLAVAIMVDNVPLPDAAAFQQVTTDQAQMATDIQQAF